MFHHLISLTHPHEKRPLWNCSYKLNLSVRSEAEPRPSALHRNGWGRAISLYKSTTYMNIDLHILAVLCFSEQYWMRRFKAFSLLGRFVSLSFGLLNRVLRYQIQIFRVRILLPSSGNKCIAIDQKITSWIIPDVKILSSKRVSFAISFARNISSVIFAVILCCW
jgi:hypothetical protein